MTHAACLVTFPPPLPCTRKLRVKAKGEVQLLQGLCFRFVCEEPGPESLGREPQACHRLPPRACGPTRVSSFCFSSSLIQIACAPGSKASRLKVRVPWRAVHEQWARFPSIFSAGSPLSPLSLCHAPPTRPDTHTASRPTVPIHAQKDPILHPIPR